MMRQAEDRMEERLWRAIPRVPALARRAPRIHDRLGQLEIPAIHVSVAVGGRGHGWIADGRGAYHRNRLPGRRRKRGDRGAPRYVFDAEGCAGAAMGRAEMTRVTCYPFYYLGHAPERFIVYARLCC